MVRGENRTMKILWLADNRSWAYASIVTHIADALPEHEYFSIYIVEDSRTTGFREMLEMLVREADVIVAMYISYPTMLPVETRAKTILFLSGLRPFYGE